MITVNGLHIPTHCYPVSPPRAYPEHYAKPYNFISYEPQPLTSIQKPDESDYQFNKREFESVLSGGIVPRCTAGYIKGSCNHQHTFYKAVFCGREYCPDCGRNGSLSHQRKVKRWNPKGQEMESMRYMVITIPESCRKAFFNTDALRKFKIATKRKLKRMGMERGMMRYHFFGDCSVCQGKGCKTCKGTGAGQKWHPHLNILTDGGYMAKDEFETFRATLNNYLKSYFKKVSGQKDIKPVFHLQYAVEPEEKAHKVKYITRATFRVFDPVVAKLLKGFRASQVWGEWPEHCKNGYKPDSGELLEAGKCPCCVEEKIPDAGLIDWKQGGNFTEEMRPNAQTFEGVTFHRLKEPECVDDGEPVVIETAFGSIELDGEPKKGKVIRTLYRHSELMEKGVNLFHVSAGYYYAEEPDYYSNSILKTDNVMANTVVPIELLNKLAALRHMQKESKRVKSQYINKEIAKLQDQIDTFLGKMINEGTVIDPKKVYVSKSDSQANLFG